MPHLSAEEARAYRGRTLDPAGLLRADRHAAECPECRARLHEPGDRERLTHDLGVTLDAALAEPGHLTDEQLDALVEDQLPASEAERCREHLAGCESCGSLLRAVNAEAESGVTWTAPVRSAQRRSAWPRLVLATGLAAAAAALLVVRTPRPDGAGPIPTRSVAAPLEALVDGQQRYTRTADGWSGLESLPLDERQALRRALEGGHADAPAWLAGLRVGHAGLLGDAQPARFELSAPLGSAVDDDQPVFSWTAHPRALAYSVTILDSRQEPAAASPDLKATEWRPPHALPAGDYVWQVAARLKSGEEEIAPGAGRPEARFRVLPASERERVAAARTALRARPLSLGLMLCRAGVVQEGTRELQRAARANPGSASLARLAASLDAQPPSPSTAKAAQ